MESPIINKLGELNPQLFREVKGRLTTRNISIATGISLIGQGLIYLYYLGMLPTRTWESNRYCSVICNPYSFGQLLIRSQLWWLDIFICMSVIGIFALLVVGSYMLMTDLSNEEKKGTLNFIRLSPQSARSILIGKMLGVPILLYLVVLLALPLHLLAGLAANIPLSLIIAFYGVLIVSCVFFYSLALLFSIFNSKTSSFQAWLASGSILFYLLFTTAFLFDSYSIVSHSAFDWLLLFNPFVVLFYLVHSTNLATNTIGYLYLDKWQEVLWYGQSLWGKSSVAISLIVINYGVGIYWLGQGLKRRFHNPTATVLSKGQTYWMSFSFAMVTLGFILPIKYLYLQGSFISLQLFNLVLFLMLIAVLSPPRQTLQDWARYRHQVSKENRSLIKDLVFGEKSPSTVAIAINLALITMYILPSIFISDKPENKIPIILGWLLGVNMVLIYAAITQLMLFMKSKKRGLSPGVTIIILIIVPVVIWTLISLNVSSQHWLLLFSIFPVAAIEKVLPGTILWSFVGQWLAITLVSLQMSRVLIKAGKSELILSGGEN